MNAPGPVPAGPFRIAIDGGASFEMAPSEDSLLRAALRAGLAFPYECSVGGCGSCRFELIDGEVRTLWAEAPGLSARDRQRGKRLACQSLPMGDCRIRVRLADAGPVVTPPRRVQASLVERRDLGADMAEFAFRVPCGSRFLPGQYALFHLPGVAGARAYSFSNVWPDAKPHTPAGDDTWRFVIRRVPGGRASTHVFEHLLPGSAVTLDGPYGHAYLRPGERDVVCVAGGSGLGPMLSVAQGVLAESGTRRVHFFLGLRSQADLGAAAVVEALVGPRLHLTTVLSAPAPDRPWAGPSGFVHEAAAAFFGNGAADFDHYFAGPPPLIDAMQERLVIQQRVAHEQIHFDRFV